MNSFHFPWGHQISVRDKRSEASPGICTPCETQGVQCTKNARSRPLPLRSHSGAKTTIWRCILFPPVSSQSQFKVRKGRFRWDFPQIFRRKPWFFAAKFTVVTESTHLYQSVFCAIFRAPLFFWKAFACHRLPEILPGFECCGILVWFLPWPIRYNLIIWACGLRCLQLLFFWQASTFGEPGFHIIPMKVIVNISYCAKAEVGKHVTCGCLTLWKLMATHRPWQVKGCDSALDLQFFHGSLVSLADQAPMSRMDGPWNWPKVMTSVCHLLSSPPTRWSAWSSKWCWWNLFPFQSR